MAPTLARRLPSRQRAEITYGTECAGKLAGQAARTAGRIGLIGTEHLAPRR